MKCCNTLKAKPGIVLPCAAISAWAVLCQETAPFAVAVGGGWRGADDDRKSR